MSVGIASVINVEPSLEGLPRSLQTSALSYLRPRPSRNQLLHGHSLKCIYHAASQTLQLLISTVFYSQPYLYVSQNIFLTNRSLTCVLKLRYTVPSIHQININSKLIPKRIKFANQFRAASVPIYRPFKLRG